MTNSNNLKLQPPKKQSSRTKKRRNSNQPSSKTANERAFDKLHQKFDPSLFGGNANEKKRNTEPANIHSERQQQLKEEGLIKSNGNNKNQKNDIQSPNIGKSQRKKKQ